MQRSHPEQRDVFLLQKELVFVQTRHALVLIKVTKSL